MELCSLGSCSRYLRDVCASDCLWIALVKRRWPSVALNLLDPDETSEHGGQGWKGVYIRLHKRIADGVSAVTDFVKQCSQDESLEVGDYLKAVEDLASIELGFEDVKICLFNVKSNVLLNLIGLHYSVFRLGIPAKDVNEALRSCKVSEREICVFLLRMGRWFFGFRIPQERSSRRVSLSQLTTPEEEDLLSILNRGAVHEVLRVHISPVAM